MKNYGIYVNLETKKFKPADWLRVGWAPAKNKDEAIEKVRAAAWGKDNDAVVHFPEDVPANRNYRTIKAEIED